MTGYRPILTGMETFASDWTSADEERRMKCLGEEALATVIPAGRPRIPRPPGPGSAPQPIRLDAGGRFWVRPANLAELGAVLREFSGKQVRMVNGNTSFGIYPAEARAAEVLVDLQASSPNCAAPPSAASGPTSARRPPTAS